MCKLDELTESCAAALAAWRCVVVARPDPDWDGRRLTDLLDERMLASGDADVAICAVGRHGRRSPNLAGPQWLSPWFVLRRIRPAGADAAAPQLGDYAGVDIAEVCRR